MIGQDRNRSHSHGNQLAGRAGGFVTGSLAWQVDRLGVGESLLKAGGTETHRRVCLRAIANVMKRQPSRKYDLDLWFALHHSGTGESVRLYRIRRVC